MEFRKIVRLTLKAIKKILPHERYIYAILGPIVRILDYLYPKDSKLILFGTKGVVGDPGALFNYINNQKTGFCGVCLQKNPQQLGQIKVFSLSGLLTFLRAKTIISSHGLYEFFYLRPSKRKLHIATWHGIMLKHSGFLCVHSKEDIRTIKEYDSSIDMVLCSSYFDATTLSFTYNHGAEKMKLTGHPRNDHLVWYNNPDKSRLKSILPWITGDEHFILYAPTFRDKEMGPDALKIPIFPFPDFDEVTFNKYLEDNKIILLIRFHLDDSLSKWAIDNKRVINFDFEVCPDINYVLGDIDALVTDYSSIAWDFLLLDRPILFVPYDFDLFSRVRGFIIDDYDFWIPGPRINTMREFLHHLEPMLGFGNDEYQEKRHALTKVIHSHQTAGSCSKVLALIREMCY